MIDKKWFQNCRSGSRSRRAVEFNRRNIFNISRIKFNGPTPRLGLRCSFGITSKEYSPQQLSVAYPGQMAL